MNDKPTIIIITICIITIIGSSFVFSGIYENFFYNKAEQTIKKTFKEINKAEKNYSKEFEKIIKRTNFNNTYKNTYRNTYKIKKEIWEEYEGMACKNNNKKCQYYFKITERICQLATNNCKITRKKITKKEKSYQRYKQIWI